MPSGLRRLYWCSSLVGPGFGWGVVEAGGELPGVQSGDVLGMPMTVKRVKRLVFPTISGAVISIPTGFPAIEDEIHSQSGTLA